MLSWVHVIEVPYDSGHRAARMGRGPGHLIGAGAIDRLRGAGFMVRETVVEAAPEFPVEGPTTFDLAGRIAAEVRITVDEGALPLVLSGNCTSAVGTACGLGGRDLGIVWFDAHGDFNTPETTDTGYLDGMGLAIAAGRCWTTMTEAMPGFWPVAEDRIVLVGPRDLDRKEAMLLRTTAVSVVPPAPIHEAGIEAALDGPLGAVRERTDRVYIHVDLDVLDPTIAPANHYRPPGGLRPEHVVDAIRLVGERFRVVGAAISAFDPECDPDGRTTAVALDLVEGLATAAARGG